MKNNWGPKKDLYTNKFLIYSQCSIVQQSNERIIIISITCAPYIDILLHD